jgi:ferredoxin
VLHRRPPGGFSAARSFAIVPPHFRFKELTGMSATKVLRVKVDRARCQGHARCFALAPELFGLDALGNGRERGEGVVPASLEAKARLAQANCPELAIEVIEE